MDILFPALTLAALGLVFGLGLAYALTLFRIEVDPTVSLIITKLPGANCGACGRAGCAGFAEALVKGEVIPAACAVAKEEGREAIAKALGIANVTKVKTVATVLCDGGYRAVNKYEYRGLRSCKAASLVFGGHKACAFGCLGLGDCAKACPFGAIVMGNFGLPEVDPKRCTACNRCVEVCPKKLYVLLPLGTKYYVKCNSTDPGAAKMKACKAGCIACRKCEKVCPPGAIRVESCLAKIDCIKCENQGKCYEVCPVKVIARR